MNRAGVFLLTLLLAQLALLGWLQQREEQQRARSTPWLLDTRGYVVDSIRLEDGSGDSALISKRGRYWALPELDGLPANAERVEALLQALTDTEPGWVVARSGAARQRLQVASYRFRRKITLSAQGRELGAVYLGTSPGFRKLHARRAGDDAIYSIFLNRHELPSRAGEWVSPDLLQVRAPLRISADGYSLQWHSGEWRLGSGKQPAEEVVQALLAALRQLRVEGIASEESAAELQPSRADMLLEVESLTGTASLEFYRQGDEHFLRSSQYPRLFRISAYDYERLSGLDSLLLAGAE